MLSVPSGHERLDEEGFKAVARGQAGGPGLTDLVPFSNRN